MSDVNPPPQRGRRISAVGSSAASLAGTTTALRAVVHPCTRRRGSRPTGQVAGWQEWVGRCTTSWDADFPLPLATLTYRSATCIVPSRGDESRRCTRHPGLPLVHHDTGMSTWESCGCGYLAVDERLPPGVAHDCAPCASAVGVMWFLYCVSLKLEDGECFPGAASGRTRRAASWWARC